jgi:transposase InsO family protein
MDDRPCRERRLRQRRTALLDKLIVEAPFKVRGIQVDGGSEFMSVFENHCGIKGLELVVLPPKRPDLNGCVERAQSSWRYAFYASYELPHRIDTLQPLVDAFAHRYNHHRPHQALGDLTPSISVASAQRPRRLISAEPAQLLDF